jgi:hypothetical protein
VSSIRVICAGAALALGFATAATAALPIYPSPGTENPDTYSFTAATTGHIIAYFAGSTAADDENLGLLVNGVDTGINGLDDHSTAVGTSLDFGSVTAGSTLTFYINDFSSGNTWYSDKAMNLDGAGGTPSQHIWSTSYAGGDFGIPAGTYVAFEDLARCCSDLNYHDETFVFTNVGVVTHGGVPEPATWAMMLVGFGGLGALMRRRHAVALAA